VGGDGVVKRLEAGDDVRKPRELEGHCLMEEPPGGNEQASCPVEKRRGNGQAPAAVVGVSMVVLRGRSDVMTAALGVARRVRRLGHGGVILVEGEPGIGKSAVFADIVTQASRMTFTCAVSKADQIGRMSPAAPLLLALRSGAPSP
jgi:predicted ATP-dependent serine protease